MNSLTKKFGNYYTNSIKKSGNFSKLRNEKKKGCSLSQFKVTVVTGYIKKQNLPLILKPFIHGEN